MEKDADIRVTTRDKEIFQKYKFANYKNIYAIKNGLSYKLGLSAMGCSLFGAFICLNSFNPFNFQVILIIILNIILLC